MTNTLFTAARAVLACAAVAAAPLTVVYAQGGHGSGGDHNSAAPQGHNSAGSHGHGGGTMQGGMMHGHGGAAGEPGKAAEATRTVEIELVDNRFSIEEIVVKKGETIRFVVTNTGTLVHEFNIGTPSAHAAHQKEMMTMAEHGALHADRIDHARMKMDMGGGKTMEHNDPNSLLLEPGKSGEVVWKFTESGDFEFACNVPGHYDAGMVGEIHVN